MSAPPSRFRILRRIATTLMALAGLILFLAWMSGVFRSKVAPEEIADERATITGRTLVPVERVRVEETVTAVGSVQPRRKADVASQILAAVLEVRVQPGDRVRAGDLLLVLDDRELVAQQREAVAAAHAIEADRDLRKREYDRIMDLPGQSVSKDERDRAVGAYNVAQAQLKRAQQTVARIEVMLTYTQIKAASPGVVADRFADPGDLAVPGKSLLSVQDTRELELHANVPESQALRVSVGQKLPLRIDAVNVAGLGTIREIVPLAQQASRSVLVKLSLPPDWSVPVYAGMFGRVTISVGEAYRLLIPAMAVREVGQLELVDVAGRESKLERRFVRTGRRFNGRVEILSGLNEGENVALPK